MIKVGIVGGTGYTGVELLRLLALHPQVKLQVITSRADAGTSVSQMFPSLRGFVDLVFTHPDEAHLEQCDAVFFATPNGIAMQQTRALLDKGVRVVDLAADFRIKDVAVWEKWYGTTHACPDLIADAVYGLPEVNREQIRNRISLHRKNVCRDFIGQVFSGNRTIINCYAASIRVSTS